MGNSIQKPLNIICFGAHPDDCEIFAGGTAVLWSQQGHRVLFVSMTNGDIGHHEIHGAELAKRRRAESERAAGLGGYQCRILDHHDGELMPTLDTRKEVIRIIREWKADLVLTHRPNDYHPDHRYTSQLVQDTAYMTAVPFLCPDSPPHKMPVYLYFVDHFTRPAPFRPDIAVAIDEVMETKWAMLDTMDSQFYEWLPWMDGLMDQVPTAPDERLRWLKETWSPLLQQPARMGQEALKKFYGDERASRIRYAEVFEICEYGRQPDPGELGRLFPFSRDPS